VRLRFDGAGNVLPNSANIQGTWYTYSDGQDTAGLDMGRCEQAGHAPSECSTITPPPGSAISPSDAGSGRMCFTGTAARIIDRIEPSAPLVDAGLADAGAGDAGSGDAGATGAQGTPDYGVIIGALAGTSLNAGLPYDALANGVTGFSFDIDTPPSAMGVLLPTLAGSNAGAPASWGGATGPSPVVAGTNSFRWADVGGPNWLQPPPPFDPTELLTLLFSVSGDPAFARPFSFCVSNIQALRD
jgi:hypothetical protein